MKYRYYFRMILLWIHEMIFKDITEPGMQTAAVMRGMNFQRGRLGNTGFRRQYVSDGNGNYKRETIAFTLPESNPSNTVLQQNQRTKFRTLAVLGGLLSRQGILRRFYYSGLGISGYNAFIRDNLQREAAIQCEDGNSYIDWPKLLIAIGFSPKKLVPYKSGLIEGVDYDPSCKYPLHLRWSNKTTKKAERGNWALVLVGIQIREDGSAEEICLLQPGATLNNCYADVLLDKCDCCKTYWFAFFTNTYTGENTTSVYLGADASTFVNLPDYDPSTCCFNCEEDIIIPEICNIPSDEPEFCGCGHDTPEVDPSGIVFTGANNVIGNGTIDIDLYDAGYNDGSGFLATNGSTGGSTSNVLITINGACPIDFAQTTFDLSSQGGGVDEVFVDGTALASRIENLLNDGTWSYNETNCTLVSGDSSVTEFSIDSNAILVVPPVSDFEVNAESNGTDASFTLRANSLIGNETSVTTKFTIGSTASIISASDFVVSDPGISVSIIQSGTTLNVETTAANGFPIGIIWTMTKINVAGTGNWDIGLLDPISDDDNSNNFASVIM
jgi:hypothetical protein